MIELETILVVIMLMCHSKRTPGKFSELSRRICEMSGATFKAELLKKLPEVDIDKVPAGTGRP